MVEAITKAELDVALKAQTEEIVGILHTFMEQVDTRFTKVEQQVASVKSDILDLKASHDRLLNTIDGFISRIDRYKTELAAHDSQFEKLLAWARKVSEKTGIPLENL